MICHCFERINYARDNSAVGMKLNNLVFDMNLTFGKPMIYPGSYIVLSYDHVSFAVPMMPVSMVMN